MLEIIHHPLTIPTTRSLDRASIHMSKIGRLCFRGDSRSYSRIFHEGFNVREGVTKRLFDKIKEIYANHLTDSLFDSKAFLEEMEALKSLVQTDATQGIKEEFSTLSRLDYGAWVEKICALEAQDGLIIMKTLKELQDYKKGTESIISRPFQSHHMISTSKRFKSALMFPEYDEFSRLEQNRLSYLYVVYVEEGFDVHMHGIVSSMLDSKPSSLAELKAIITKVNPSLTEERVDEKAMRIQSTQKILNITLDEALNFFAEEIVSEMIPRECIIAAICVQRQLLLRSDGFTQGTYKLGDEIHINPECSLPQETIDQVSSFLMEEIRLNKIAIVSKQNTYNAILAEPEDGYKKGHGTEFKA